MQLLKRRRRLDAQLLHEHPTGVLVRLERLGLPSAPIQGEHELPAGPLPERVVAHERLRAPRRAPQRRQVPARPRSAPRPRSGGAPRGGPLRSGRSPRRGSRREPVRRARAGALPAPVAGPVARLAADRASFTSCSKRRASTASSSAPSAYPGARVSTTSAPSAFRSCDTAFWSDVGGSRRRALTPEVRDQALTREQPRRRAWRGRRARRAVSVRRAREPARRPKPRADQGSETRACAVCNTLLPAVLGAWQAGEDVDRGHAESVVRRSHTMLTRC